MRKKLDFIALTHTHTHTRKEKKEKKPDRQAHWIYMLNQPLSPQFTSTRAGELKTCCQMRVWRKRISKEEERQVEARIVKSKLLLFKNNTCTCKTSPAWSQKKKTTKSDRRCKSLFPHNHALSAQFCLCLKLKHPWIEVHSVVKGEGEGVGFSEGSMSGFVW